MMSKKTEDIIKKRYHEIVISLKLPPIAYYAFLRKAIRLSGAKTKISTEGIDKRNLVGMSRGLIYAGAESILASLWSVDDRSTAILMTKFYENWRSGMTNAEALRRGQIYLKAMKGTNTPSTDQRSS